MKAKTRQAINLTRFFVLLLLYSFGKSSNTLTHLTNETGRVSRKNRLVEKQLPGKKRIVFH